jgi:D-alanyl-D-alanine carboxypeptidase
MDFTKLSTAILCILLLSVTAHANEESRIWSRIGPEGADISQLIISSSQPNTLYAATTPSSYYSSSHDYLLKSLKGGDSWVTLPQLSHKNFTCLNIEINA